jgi:hypothetical protein
MKCVALVLPLVLAASLAQAGGGPPPMTTTTVDNDPTLFLGLAWTFGSGGGGSAGGTAGITLKALTTNERNAPALGAGVTYNFNGSFGCDISLAWNDDDVTLTAGYDLCQKGLQMGIGGTTRPDVTTVIMSPPT